MAGRFAIGRLKLPTNATPFGASEVVLEQKTCPEDARLKGFEEIPKIFYCKTCME